MQRFGVASLNQNSDYSEHTGLETSFSLQARSMISSEALDFGEYPAKILASTFHLGDVGFITDREMDMIGNKSALDLQEIAAQGGSFEVDGNQYSLAELESIAGRLKPGASLKIFNSDTFGEMECQLIAARSGEGATVIFS
jgi:hypothetical protein